MISTRLRAFYHPFIAFLPQVGLALLLFLGGRAVIDGRLDLGEFTAFYVYMLALIGPMRAIGWILSAVAARDRLGARASSRCSTACRGSSRAPDAGPLPPGSGRVELRGATLAYEEGARARAARRHADRRGGHDDRPRRRHRLGQDDARRG